MATDLQRALQPIQRPVDPISPMLLTAAHAAHSCGKSLRTWRSWHAQALIPAPLKISKSLLWRADELRRWVEAGCPRRDMWEAMER